MEIPKGYRVVRRGLICKGDLINIFGKWQPAANSIGSPAGTSPWNIGDVCRPITLRKRQTRAANSDYATALWNELKRRCPVLVPEKTDWVPVTRKRLNSAVRNCA